jgi:hypothetical protein
MPAGYPGHSHFFGGYRLLIQVAPGPHGGWRVWAGNGSEPREFALREEAERFAIECAETSRPCTLRIIRAWGVVERECEYPEP